MQHDMNEIVADYQRYKTELENISCDAPDQDNYNHLRSTVLDQIENLEERITETPGLLDRKGMKKVLEKLRQSYSEIETFTTEMHDTSLEEAIWDMSDADDYEVSTFIPKPEELNVDWPFDYQEALIANITASLFKHGEENDRTFFFMPEEFDTATATIMGSSTDVRDDVNRTFHYIDIKVAIRCKNTIPTTDTTNQSSSTTLSNEEDGPTKPTPT
jgi:hypothetical protein